jgi:hypothetical protein
MKATFTTQSVNFVVALTLAIATAIVVLVGCQTNSPAEKPNDRNITYFQDSRTKVCFAAMNSQVDGYMSTSIATVPCEQVRNLLIEQ